MCQPAPRRRHRAAPTAGLDPEDRVRFLNLLGEIGESTAVIPSTHIIEDVEELCSSMAIIDRAEILLTATPARAIAEVRGRVWRRTGAGKSPRSSANRR
jgi:ABC-2 type transport system ATP-binding protein